jgi:hypothetical protein
MLKEEPQEYILAAFGVQAGYLVNSADYLNSQVKNLLQRKWHKL